MDCNKEEALRAKVLAEQKMQNRDFPGARKFALRAQQLFPDVENIAQMLVVCDVHCSAEQKLYGNEMNWYKILQIEVTADEATIKKQYRKFALQLHPDKNKYAGAEAAFKLIGEAQRILLDREKRSELDRKFRVVMHGPSMAPHHQQKFQMNYNSVTQNTVRPNFTTFNPWQQQQQPSQTSQQGINGDRATFWTACSFCSVRYEYYREVLNRSLRCQHCNKPFIAYDVDVQGTTPATNLSQQTFTQRTYGLNHGAVKVDFGAQANLHTKKSDTESRANKGSTSDVSKKPNGKRSRKQMVESSESSDSFSSDSDDMFANDDGFTDLEKNSASREEHPRRSTRQKHQVSYNENASDDDDDESFEPSRINTGNESSNPANEMNIQNGLASALKDNKKGVKRDSEEDLVNRNAKIKEVRGEEVVGDSKVDEASENDVYPDPEFSDFDKDKKEESFAAGQIWAIYDMADGMPRFYALIKKVMSPGFKLRITWLEPDPDDDDEISWSIQELPIACGKYKLGSSDIIEGHETFSHMITCEKVGRSSFNVYPRKGETWALFKNWDIKWHKDAESHRKFDFEFVEILSNYVEGDGVFVALLGKLKGFVSLFFPILKDGNPLFQIPSTQLFRFSHRVPSFRMTGQEGVGVPMGSLELDPVSLPTNLDEIELPGELIGKTSQSPSVGMSSRSSDALKFMMKSDTHASTSKINLEGQNSTLRTKAPVDHIANGSAPSASVAAAIQVPKQQFFNFDEERSKVGVGQVWASYGGQDGAPRYYGLIISIKPSPDFEVHVLNLTNCWIPDTAVKWDDKKMIVPCGRFRVIQSPVVSILKDINSFSHLLHPVTDGNGRDKEFIIFPKKGQVWALYRKWTTKIRRADLLKMEYDIVEVVEEDNNSLGIEVLPLEKVSGYHSVFKGKSNGRSPATQRIPSRKLLMFSHQIPAFRLTEKHGNLKGFLEINPRALPANYLNDR
ncbi:hypothetical protein HN51_064850 [Arachis hypogaea]|uniref:uncharacterized protein LOC107638525 n=1 Tax=Arachis ipaensis TaxID=130454 RepID=UPI0007AF17A9|nr:uncharacterized protein LOC107638525 [Arachis ipaensis]XP_016197332.1 uncharacterized protein LOC107638525 [Arachis ipaensis]XP_020976187.1 uncharacterized protein LOC107638525 [Arachis ipaensis]XP_025645714.1 uncharacterized protein LOC112741097 [Arachis hypogaea]XP_025645715.1 uncharacterized protein LOC112741097 [Arachis hypogaea]QHO05879.1 Chaperone protein DnaJ [Arachis hypogaea]QHO05880.1 Chaperone protein DnaJ [Arachis hypogaea]